MTTLEGGSYALYPVEAPLLSKPLTLNSAVLMLHFPKTPGQAPLTSFRVNMQNYLICQAIKPEK